LRGSGVGIVCRYRSQGAGIQGAAGKEVAIEHEAAADEGPDEDVKVIDVVAAPSKHQFSGAGGGNVVVEVDGPGTEPCELGPHVGGAPGIAIGLGGAELLRPRPHLIRGGDAEPGDPADPFRRQALQQLVDAFHGEAADSLGRRVAIDLMQEFQDLAVEIDEIEVGAAAADLEAEGEGALGVERIGHGGLPHPSALRLALEQQAIGSQLVDDERNGLGGEAGQAGDIGLGEARMVADERQHQALVIEPDARLVAAPTKGAGTAGPPGGRIGLARAVCGGAVHGFSRRPQVAGRAIGRQGVPRLRVLLCGCNLGFSHMTTPVRAGRTRAASRDDPIETVDGQPAPRSRACQLINQVD
jgi:hypothetical protein